MYVQVRYITLGVAGHRLPGSLQSHPLLCISCRDTDRLDRHVNLPIDQLDTVIASSNHQLPSGRVLLLHTYIGTFRLAILDAPASATCTTNSIQSVKEQLAVGSYWPQKFSACKFHIITGILESLEMEKHCTANLKHRHQVTPNSLRTHKSKFGSGECGSSRRASRISITRHQPPPTAQS